MTIVIPLFPLIAHGLEIEDFKKDKKKLLKFVYNEEKKDNDGLELSNAGGWHSNNNYHEHDNLLRDLLSKYVQSFFGNRNVFNSEINPHLIGLWMNINRKGDYNKSHIHPDSHLSGVFWIKCPPDSGHLTFQSPHYFSQYNEVTSYTKEFRDQTISHPTYNVFSEEGRMIIFPSSLYHHVEPNKSDEDRISVSFNINLVPKEGYVTS